LGVSYTADTQGIGYRAGGDRLPGVLAANLIGGQFQVVLGA
jgi:hypothetical protein